MWDLARRHWRDNGTKILGYFGMILGALQTATLWFTPKGLQVVGVLAAVVGGFTVRRGYVNTARKDDDDQH